VKIRSRAQACSAGAAALALMVGLVGAAGAGVAVADTEPVAGALPAPTGLTPDDSTSSVPRPVLKSVTLDWAPVSGATGYRVQVGVDGSWSDDPTLTEDVVSSRFTLPVWLPHASYVWRVAALKAGKLGKWSSETGQPQSEAQFTRGWRVAPVPNAVAVPFEQARPTYSWSPVVGASGYQLQIDDDPWFDSQTTAAPDTSPAPGSNNQASDHRLSNCFTNRTRVTPAQDRVGAASSIGECNFKSFAPGQTVYWRVRALDSYVGTASEVNTTPVAAGGVSQLPPATDDEQTDVTSPCPTPVEPVDGDPTPDCAPASASEYGGWSTVSQFAYTGSDVAGAYDPNALVRTTTLDTEPDGLCDVVNAGAADAEKAVCSDFPSISWDPAPGATRYRVYVGLDDQFDNIQAIVESSGNQWTAARSWRDSSPALSYYYAVQACTAAQCGAVTSTPPSFRKVTPRLTAGARPPVTGEFQLGWSSYLSKLAAASGQAATQDAHAYHVQVASADHPGFDVLVDDVLVDETSYFPTATSYGDGAFLWRVQAVDSSGNKLPFSLSQAFTRDTSGPQVVSVSPSAKVAPKAPLRVTFSEPVQGVTSSTLTAVRKGGAVAPATVSLAADRRSATLTPTQALLPGATYTVKLASSVSDAAGNAALGAGRSITVNPLVDDGSAAMTYSGGWSRLAASNAVGGTFRQAGTAGRTATLAFSGSKVTVRGCLSPSGGLVRIAVGGVSKQVSTYRSYSGCGVTFATLTGFGSGPHTLKMTVIGRHVAASKGNVVGFDAVTVTP
jgi:hypothetical protein